MQKLETYSPYQFSITRIIMGIYLVIHFACLIPYGTELFSNQGILPQASLNFTYPFFPNPLYYFDSPIGVSIFLIVLTLLSVLLTLGYKRRLVSLLLWFGFAACFNRNNLINNPSLAFVGWILLAFAALPSGDPIGMDEKNEEWAMPKELFYGAWIIMGLSYTISGYHKMGSPGWMNGTAIGLLVENPLARDYFLRELVLMLPEWVIKIKTWFILGLEVLFFPLIFFKWGRIAAWTLMVAMHFGILSLVNFADLTTGVLMIHLFTFDASWLKAKAPAEGEEGERIVFFDGVCGICNGFVDFLFQEDKAGYMKVSALQGEKSKEVLDKKDYENLDSIVFYENGKAYYESEAILKIFAYLPGLWRLISFTVILPEFLRNAVYKLIAKNRYRIFGKKEACRMPTPEERARFIN